MGHIFISYSHKDTDYAHGLASNLQSMGFDIWIDERLDYGSQWPHEIQKQLDTCEAFILVMSPRSFASEWVQSELQRAKRKLKPIFPLLLEGDEPWLSVESTQYYDVRGGRFPDDKFYSALKRVVAVSNNSQTLEYSKKPVKTARAAAPSTLQSKTGIGMTIALAVIVVSMVCVGIFWVLRGKSLFSASTIPSPEAATATLNSSLATLPVSPASPIPQQTETLVPTLAPSEALIPTLTPPPPPTLPPPTFTPSPVPTAVPPTPIPNLVLYSWWSEQRGDNWITTNPLWTGIQTPGPDYYFVRVEGYVYSPDAPQPSGTIPLYSWWSESRDDNWATTNPLWTGIQTPGPDYYFVRLEGYLYSPDLPQPSGTIPLYSWWSESRDDNWATTNPLWTGIQTPGPDYYFVRLEGYVRQP